MQSHEAYLKRAIELSVKSRESGNTPFAALLVDKDGNIIMEQMNNEITEHKCTKNFSGTAHFTQRQSLVPCVPVPFTGATSAMLCMP